MSAKINPLVIIDFETGGLDNVNKMHSKKVAVVQVAALAVNGYTFEEIIRYDNIVKPYSQTHEYQSQAAAINGITKERCIAEGVSVVEVVKDIKKLFIHANVHKDTRCKPVMVAHNWPFERQFLTEIWSYLPEPEKLQEYIDCGLDDKGNVVPNGIDTLALAKQAFPDNASHSLKNACLAAGVKIEPNHKALKDVMATLELMIFFTKKLRGINN